jgi:hypothetical protein
MTHSFIVQFLKILRPSNFLRCFPCGSVTKFLDKGTISISHRPRKLGSIYVFFLGNLTKEVSRMHKKVSPYEHLKRIISRKAYGKKMDVGKNI